MSVFSVLLGLRHLQGAHQHLLVLLAQQGSFGMGIHAVHAFQGHINRKLISSALHALIVHLVVSVTVRVQHHYVQAQYFVKQDIVHFQVQEILLPLIQILVRSVQLDTSLLQVQFFVLHALKEAVIVHLLVQLRVVCAQLGNTPLATLKDVPVVQLGLDLWILIQHVSQYSLVPQIPFFIFPGRAEKELPLFQGSITTQIHLRIGQVMTQRGFLLKRSSPAKVESLYLLEEVYNLHFLLDQVHFPCLRG